MRPVAIVTGSAKGIGRTLLLTLARSGYDVVVHYRTSREEAEAVAAAARAEGVDAIPYGADVRVEEEAHGLVDATVDRYGRVDVLVNNVGNYHYGPLSDLDAVVWHEMMDSNLHATFYTCQRAVPHLRSSPSGRIVNLGFAGAGTPVAKPGIVPYQIAKTGVLLYSLALAKREARHGTTVNVIAPGVIENSVAMPMNEIPMGRPGRLTEVAGALRYLISEEARYVTGATLPVSGGWNL